MRVLLKELLDKLGVGYVMGAYETCPWSIYDESKGVTCSAEVRMNEDANLLEAELQLLYDNPPDGKSPLEQIFWMPCKPTTGDKWSPLAMKIRGEDKTNSTYDWESKGCAFFSACVQEMKMGSMPDIDEILSREITDKERFGGGAGGGSSKSPKIKPQQLLGMKAGRGI